MVYKISTKLYKFIFYIVGSISFSSSSSDDTSISLCFSSESVGSYISNYDSILITSTTGSSGSGSTSVTTVAQSNSYRKFSICIYPYSNGSRTVSGVNVNFNVYYI